MGLLDVLNGMQNGPRGQGASAPTSSSAGGGGIGGMSPMTMAMLGLLAFKAIKSFTGNQPSAAPSRPGAVPGGTTQPQSPGATGGMGDLLKTGLGGLLAGGAAGSVLSGGLNDLLKQFQQTGKGEVAQSWVGSGPNKKIEPDDLASALGADRINTMTKLSGMSRDDMLSQLSDQLPDVVDQLTPDGRVPTEQEAQRFV
jgi:uncharacterized protein YidB (DUF937 family)